MIAQSKEPTPKEPTTIHKIVLTMAPVATFGGVAAMITGKPSGIALGAACIFFGGAKTAQLWKELKRN